MSFQTNLQVSAGTSNADNSPNPAPGIARLDYGDYTGLAFNNGNFYPVWADNSNSTGDNPQGALSGFDLYTAQVSIALTPSNDNLTNSVGLTGAALRTSGTNTNATLEADEPNIGGIPGGNSVWWSWTAPFSGRLTINTFGSDFNTLLGVFTAEADGLTPVASNDDASGTFQSRVTFDVAAGTTYLIDVDGYQGASGKIALALKEIPFNNKLAKSITLTGDSVSTSGTNINATVEAGEPNISGIPGGHSVWWSWTAPFSGTTTLNTFGSDFDTLLGVFTGSTVSRLTPVGSNDDAGGTFQSEVTFEVVTGTIYRINVDGYQRAFGNIALTLNAVPLSENLP